MRVRHFRGHGVHSPFVYTIVRQVFMRRTLLGECTDLRDALLASGVSERRALELQNLMTHCGYRTFTLCGRGQAGEEAEVCILSESLSEPETLHLVRAAVQCGATAVVMEPYADRERERMCRTIVAAHDSTSVDNRGYLLLFNNRNLPKQHLRI